MVRALAKRYIPAGKKTAPPAPAAAAAALMAAASSVASSPFAPNCRALTIVPESGELEATGVATGVDTKTKTNGEGLYNFPRLNPGVYTLVVQKQGYKKQEFQQVSVSIGLTPTSPSMATTRSAIAPTLSKNSCPTQSSV